MTNNRFNLFAFLMVLVFSGISCSAPLPMLDSKSASTKDLAQSLSDKISREEFTFNFGDKFYQLIVYSFNPGDLQARIHHDVSAKRLHEWSEIIDSDVLINGSYFSDIYQPTGRLVINGKELGSYQYDADKSGVFFIQNGKPDLIDTALIEIPEIDEKTSLVQSFPLIIKSGGKDGITEDSQKIARRTVLAKNKSGKFLIIIVDQTPISLYELMKVLQKSKLEIDLALNLDGGPSTGIISSIGDWSESIIPLGLLPQVITFSEHLPG